MSNSPAGQKPGKLPGNLPATHSIMSKHPPHVLGISLTSPNLSTPFHHHQLSPNHIISQPQCSPDWMFCTNSTHCLQSIYCFCFDHRSIFNTTARVPCTKYTSDHVTSQPPPCPHFSFTSHSYPKSHLALSQFLLLSCSPFLHRLETCCSFCNAFPSHLVLIKQSGKPTFQVASNMLFGKLSKRKKNPSK